MAPGRQALERTALLQLAALSATVSCCTKKRRGNLSLGQRVLERFKARFCAGVVYCPAQISQMQSVAVLSAVCRRWRASLTLIDQVAAQVSVSYASQTIVGECLIACNPRGNVGDCKSFGTTLPATNCAFRTELTTNLLKTHWSNGERKRQVSL